MNKKLKKDFVDWFNYTGYRFYKVNMAWNPDYVYTSYDAYHRQNSDSDLWRREYMNTPDSATSTWFTGGGTIYIDPPTSPPPRVVHVPTIWFPNDITYKYTWDSAYPRFIKTTHIDKDGNKIIKHYKDGEEIAETFINPFLKGDDMNNHLLSEDFICTMASNLAQTIKHYRETIEEDRRNIVDLTNELGEAQNDFDKHTKRFEEIEAASADLMEIIRNNCRSLLDCDDVKLLVDTLTLGQ